MWMILIRFDQDLIRRDLPIALPTGRRRAIVRIGSRRACANAGDDPMTTTTSRRRADMARPEKRGDRWRARVWNPFTQKYDTVPNEDDTRYTTFPTETAADVAQRAALVKMLKAYEDAGVDPVKQRAAHPFRHVVQQWLPLLDGSRQTRTNRADTVRRLVVRFGDTDINAIDEDDFRQYMRDMEEAGLAPNTIQLRLVVMRMIVDYAHRKGYLDADKDPVQGIKYKPYRLKDPGTLDDQTFILLTYYFPWWLEAAAYLGYDEGLRAGEVAGLTWKRILGLGTDNPRVVVQDVAEKDGTIRPLTKGRKTVTLALTQRSADALCRLQALRPEDGPDDRIFRTPLGTPMIPRYVGDHMRAAWIASGLPGERPTFHCLRHSCATNMADAGVDMRTIMERMRHGDPKTTMAYIRAAGDRAQVEAIGMVEAMFANKLRKPGPAEVTSLPARMSPEQAAALQVLLTSFTQQAA
jgi:integrase